MAITDVFFRRYATVGLQEKVFVEDSRFFHQANRLIGDPLWLGQEPGEKPQDATEGQLKLVHDKLALELGRDFLSPAYWYIETKTTNGNKKWPHRYSYANIIKNFMNLRWEEGKYDADQFMKHRLSLVEIAFAERWAQIQKLNADIPNLIANAEQQELRLNSTGSFRVPGRLVDGVKARNAEINGAWERAVYELNERLRIAQIKLNFHNGLLQFSDDELSNEQAVPFWSVVGQPIWANVDTLMKEAIDKRDRGERDAVTPALQSLESAIKIISDEKGWTRGTEKGAANYIDNLVVERNGKRFIEVWEKDVLIKLFGDIRNWFGHGPGSKPMPALLPQQTEWAIDTSITWIKSLIRRM